MTHLPSIFRPALSCLKPHCILSPLASLKPILSMWVFAICSLFLVHRPKTKHITQLLVLFNPHPSLINSFPLHDCFLQTSKPTNPLRKPKGLQGRSNPTTFLPLQPICAGKVYVNLTYYSYLRGRDLY